MFRRLIDQARSTLASTRHGRTRSPRRRLHLETLEERCLLSGYRSWDGTGNNLAHPSWGRTGSQLLRQAPVAYADGIAAPNGADRPGARAISNAVIDETEEVLNERLMSDFIYVFGQMLDHDLDLTINATPAQAFNIPVPLCDPFFDLGCTGTQVIGLNRSKFDPATGTSRQNPRQQVNEVTSWLDGSVIYGSDAERARALRTLQGGRLKTSAGDLLPYNTMGLENQIPHGTDPTRFFVAGDRRVNENIELTAIQTVFLREHNRLAARIQTQHPGLSDEEIFQRARRLVVGQLQHITYREYLPALLGPNALRPYNGYRPSVNPGIKNEFSTVGFRVGHTLLGDDVEFLDDYGEEMYEELPLSEAFFNPEMVRKTGIEPILKYLATDKAREVDTVIVGGVRNFLFGPPGAGGFDLAALDIQRAREHGLPDYNTMRAAYGLPRVRSFAQITSDRELQRHLRELYGDVNGIDAFVGGLAEDRVDGASVGPLFRRIIAEQFERIRDGDRFWYGRDLSGRELAEVRQTSLADLLRRNTALTNLQDDAFFFKVTISGVAFHDRNGNGRRDGGEPSLRNWRVELEDEQGNLLATERTEADGSYRFTGHDGLDGPGTYTVIVTPQPGWQETSVNPHDVRITRGMTVRGVNAGFQRVGSGPGSGSEDGAGDTAATLNRTTVDVSSLAQVDLTASTGALTPRLPESDTDCPLPSDEHARRDSVVQRVMRDVQICDDLFAVPDRFGWPELWV